MARVRVAPQDMKCAAVDAARHRSCNAASSCWSSGGVLVFRSFSLALGMSMYRDTMQIAYTPHVRQEHARLWFGSKRSCAALAVFDPKPMFLIYRCLGVLPCVLVFVSCLGLSLWFHAMVSCFGVLPWFLALLS